MGKTNRDNLAKIRFNLVFLGFKIIGQDDNQITITATRNGNSYIFRVVKGKFENGYMIYTRDLSNNYDYHAIVHKNIIFYDPEIVVAGWAFPNPHQNRYDMPKRKFHYSEKTS